MIAWLLAGGLAMALMILWVQYRRLTLEHNQLRQKALTQERQWLKARMDPHFLFNALSSIRNLLYRDEKESALRYLTRFAALLRETMHEQADRLITLEEEIRLLEHYLELEALRFDQPFTWQVRALDGLDVHTTELPLLIIQPFVENAIHHGLAPADGRGHIEVHFQDGGAYIIGIIRDNGIGRSAAAQQRKKDTDRPSQGIEITRQRLTLMAPGAVGEIPMIIRDLYHADGSPAGTEVTLRIPKPHH
jgi:LytS/YehU family sensor histidine kinase